jgi:hypothetical protein
MLKLFFSDSADPEQRIENVRAMRARHLRTLSQLRAIESAARSRPGPYLTLRLGIGLHEWVVRWCESTERELTEAQR